MTPTRNIPALRFAEFTDEWQEKPLGEVIENHGGTSLEQFMSEEGDYHVISIGNYNKYGKYIDNGKRIILNEKSKSKLLNKNDLVMVLNDKTQAGEIIGATILIDESNKYIYNQRSERMICRKDIIPAFAWHNLNSDFFRKKIFSISQGGTQIYINFRSAKELEISLPTLAEQQKIADFLSAVDEAIEAETGKLQSLQAHKKGLMQQLFPREGETLPARRFPEFSTAWQEKNFGELCKFVRGPFGGSLKKEIFQKDGYAVYEQQHAIYGDFQNIRYFIDEKKFNEMKRFELHAGDLIMSCSGTMGKVVIVPTKIKQGVINQALLLLSPLTGLSNVFLYYWMNGNGFLQSMKKEAGGAAIQNVASVSILKTIMLSLPSLPEQQKIAECLSSLDELLQAQGDKITALKQHKKGLMQQLFPQDSS